MTIAFRCGLFALAFGGLAVEATAQGMGSGPIQTLPWAAKQRSTPNRDIRKGSETDTQPTDALRADPIVGASPAQDKPQK